MSRKTIDKKFVCHLGVGFALVNRLNWIRVLLLKKSVILRRSNWTVDKPTMEDKGHERKREWMNCWGQCSSIFCIERSSRLDYSFRLLDKAKMKDSINKFKSIPNLCVCGMKQQKRNKIKPIYFLSLRIEEKKNSSSFFLNFSIRRRKTNRVDLDGWQTRVNE